jgi:hypothetical protein
VSVECQVQVHGELLTRVARPQVRVTLDLCAASGRASEVVIPDGTVGLRIAFSATGLLEGVWLTSDASLQVWLGDRAQNDAVGLSPQGVLALLGSDLPGADGVSVSYQAGTGVPAHLLVYALGEAVATMPTPPDSWQWVPRYRETFDWVTTWTTGATGHHGWETQLSSQYWQIDPSTHENHVWITSGQIAGAGSMRWTRQDPAITYTNIGAWFYPLNGSNMPFALSSGRWRTWYKMETPTNVGGATGSHWVGLRWLMHVRSQAPQVWEGYGLVLENPVNTGTLTTWRFGRFFGGTGQNTGQGLDNFTTLASGPLPGAPIAVGTVIELEAEWRWQGGDEDTLQMWLRYGLQGQALTELTTFLSFYGDTTPFISGGTTNEGGTVLYAPLGDFRVLVDESDITRLNYSQSNSLNAAFYGWDSRDLLMTLYPYAPILGQASWRVRRGKDLSMATGLQWWYLYRSDPYDAVEPPPNEGRLRGLWRVDACAGTRLSTIGLHCLDSDPDSYPDDASMQMLGLLYEMQQSTAQWTRLVLVHWPAGLAQPYTTLASVARSGAVLGSVVALELEWRREGAGQVTLQGRIGSSLTYSDLSLALEATTSWSFPSSAGEGPCGVCDYDGADGDYAIVLDEVQLDELVRD